MLNASTYAASADTNGVSRWAWIVRDVLADAAAAASLTADPYRSRGCSGGVIPELVDGKLGMASQTLEPLASL